MHQRQLGTPKEKNETATSYVHRLVGGTPGKSGEAPTPGDEAGGGGADTIKNNTAASNGSSAKNASCEKSSGVKRMLRELGVTRSILLPCVPWAAARLSSRTRRDLRFGSP